MAVICDFRRRNGSELRVCARMGWWWLHLLGAEAGSDAGQVAKSAPFWEVTR